MLKGVNLKVSQKRRNGTYNTGRGRLCCILKSLLNMKITLFLKLFNLLSLAKLSYPETFCKARRNVIVYVYYFPKQPPLCSAFYNPRKVSS